MVEDNNIVTLIRPDGKTMDLGEAVNLTIRRSAETGLPVGLGGHTIECPQMDVEAGTDCETCEHDDVYTEKCVLGIPKSDGLVNCSAQFNDTLQYCKQYKTRRYMECTCGMDQQSAEK